MYQRSPRDGEKLERSQLAATEAHRRSNLHEQYSRKTNFKIMGVPGIPEQKTCELVKSFLKKTAKVELPDREIMASIRTNEAESIYVTTSRKN